MGPNLKLTDVATKVVSTNERKGMVVQGQEDEGMPRNMNKEVDPADCMNYRQFEVIDVDCQDTTEYSSSFGDTVSGDENGLFANDDLEVESRLCNTKLCESSFDGCDGRLLGKRKLTDHWMKFRNPLKWRCKWLEVKLREIKFQELKYERELAKYCPNEQCELEKVALEGFDAEPQHFHSKIQTKEVMKRKKRKRVENTADLASYMSHHNIFSHYESKKSVAASALVEDWGDLDNKTTNGYDDNGCNDEFLSLQSSTGDNLSEQILLKIEVLQSRIHKLKNRMDKVVSESTQKFSSVNMLSSLVPSDILNDAENHPYPKKRDRNGSQCTISQHASEYDMRDDFNTGSAVSNHEEVAPLPDMIRSMSQSLLAISSGDIEREILIPNQAAKEELRDFGGAITQQAEKPFISMENVKPVSVVQRPGGNLLMITPLQPDAHMNTSLQPDAQPHLSQVKQPDKKRTIGRQTSSLGRWRRRSSG